MSGIEAENGLDDLPITENLRRFKVMNGRNMINIRASCAFAAVCSVACTRLCSKQQR